MNNNSDQSTINWSDPILANILFFRDQSKLLRDAYNPSQIASGALMTVMIMNHNLLMSRLNLIDQRLETLEKLINDSKSPSD